MKKNRVLIIKIGNTGNLLSVERALIKAGAEITKYYPGIDSDKFDKVVLPGVGSFKDTMEYLKENLNEIKKIINNKLTLGICLGMQILATLGFENGETEGFNIINGEVNKFSNSITTPHLGWNKIRIVENDVLFKNIDFNNKFYFMHSYKLVNYTNILALTNHEGHEFVSVVKNNNVYGVQFHPEKSGNDGINLLKNFVNMEVK
jgi:imidazole glycerol phosphate synthase glutamine amidotransferase subunit